MKRFAFVLMMFFFALGTLWAQGDRDKTIDRVESAGTILNEIMSAPDSGIPEEIFDSAKCIAVVPTLLKGGLGFGAAYGKGVASCRTEKGWSAPAFFTVKGGSFGLQIGGQAVDLVMVVMNDEGMRALLKSKFELGVDASAAAGPVGRHASADTDWKMQSQILTYSRARGIFAGLTLKGSVVTQGKDDTRAFYGRMVPFRTILNGNVAAPEDSKPFLEALVKYGGGPAPTPAPAATPAPATATPGTTGK
ncbi:MAG: lipid-binding SYLF domain-containing protein [Terriglobales bacterium]